MVGNQASPLLDARTLRVGGGRGQEASIEHEKSALQTLRLRRAELRESISTLECALAAPAVDSHARWMQRIHVALVELSADLREHIIVTDSPGGLHHDLLWTAPRLAGAAARLTREHALITHQVEELLARVGAPHSDQVVDIVRNLGTTLLTTLTRHRQRGSDLVYQAYEVDIGGGD